MGRRLLIRRSSIVQIRASDGIASTFTVSSLESLVTLLRLSRSFGQAEFLVR
jgi:hypothetical protein